MVKSLLTIIVSIAFLFGTRAQSIEGQWKGLIHYDQVDVPFQFKVESLDGITVTLINGEERLVCKDSEVRDDSLFIRVSPFDVRLKAKISADKMSGVWAKGYRNSAMPFTAKKDEARFQSGKHKVSLEEKWQLTFTSEGSSNEGVGLFTMDKAKATGTILTRTGDYRYMSGVYRNDSLLLSSFDGAHGFLLAVKVDGKELSGIFHMDNNYTEQVSGKAEPAAGLPGPFKSIEGGQRPFFDILSAGDPEVKIDKNKYFDKVLIIQLLGTWCPNSMDQTKFLKEWYQNKPEHVEVLAVTYEPNFSTAYGNKRISDYKEDLQLPYDVRLGGQLSKGQAALALPYSKKINAFPTLILVDKAGFIRYEFDYFNGPATGVYYDNFKEKFEQLIAELSAE